MKTTTKIITLLASVTLLTACGNNQKPSNVKEPQTEQTKQPTETSKSNETTEPTKQTKTVTHSANVDSTEDKKQTYHPQLGGTYPTGTKAFV